MDAISDSETIVIAMLMTLVPGIIIGSNGLSAASTGKRTLILWRVDAKLDLLLKHADLAFDSYKSLPPGVAEAVQRGEKIRAIKFYREATGVGLKEAKDFVEEIQRRGSAVGK